MKRNIWLVIFAILICGILVFNNNIYAKEFYYKNLGSLEYSYASDINDKNQVIGHASGDGGGYSFLWSEEEGMQYLAPIFSASAINNNGWISGSAEYEYVDTDFTTQEAALMSPDRTIQRLSSFVGDRDCNGYSLNDSNQVLFDSWTINIPFILRHYLWEPGPLITRLSFSAYDINNIGQIVGWDISSESPQAVLGNKGGITQYLDESGYDASQATAINDKGYITGQLYNSGGDHHACLWKPTGEVKDLGTLSKKHYYSWGNDINNKGEIVGLSGTSLSTSRRAFLWTETEGMQDLNELVKDLPKGLIFTEANAINNEGNIVGVDSNNHAFLLWAPKQHVLLLHGLWSNAEVWEDSGVQQLLEENGFIAHPIDFCPNNGPIEDEAYEIALEIFRIINEEPAAAIYIVAHSKGGLAARYYLAHQDWWPVNDDGTSHHKVKKLITLGTPHLGTDIHLLHPIVANIKEFKNKYDAKIQCEENIYWDYVNEEREYHFNVWSPALQEMTASWKPPSKWGKGKRLVEPMSKLERSAVLAYSFAHPDRPEFFRLSGLFPKDFDDISVNNHIDYYIQMEAFLNIGAKYSTFLEDLNSQPIPNDIDFYFLYGTNNVIINFFDLLGSANPFTLIGDYGDGIVPLQSATAKGLRFRNQRAYPVEANHLTLLSVGKDLILECLNYGPIR